MTATTTPTTFARERRVSDLNAQVVYLLMTDPTYRTRFHERFGDVPAALDADELRAFHEDYRRRTRRPI